MCFPTRNSSKYKCENSLAHTHTHTHKHIHTFNSTTTTMNCMFDTVWLCFQHHHYLCATSTKLWASKFTENPKFYFDIIGSAIFTLVVEILSCFVVVRKKKKKTEKKSLFKRKIYTATASEKKWWISEEKKQQMNWFYFVALCVNYFPHPIGHVKKLLCQSFQPEKIHVCLWIID